MKFIIKTVLVSTILLFSINSINAQVVTKGNTNSWFLLLNRFNLSEKFAVTNELHERTGSFLSDQATFIFRPSIDYSLNKNTEFSIGYSYVRSWPYTPYSLKTPINEHNIWEQALLKFTSGKVQMLNRIRFEHRFIDKVVSRPVAGGMEYYTDGTNFTNRFRFRFNLSFDIVKINNGKNAIFVNAFDELWINQSDNLMPTSFGRNWIYTGLGYKFNSNFNIQLAHMHQYDKVGNNNFVSSSIIQLTVFKGFNFYKQDPTNN